MTTRIQKAFFDVVNGRNRKYKGWLTPVAAARKSPARKTAKGK
jgi:hypothetical protein